MCPQFDLKWAELSPLVAVQFVVKLLLTSAYSSGVFEIRVTTNQPAFPDGLILDLCRFYSKCSEWFCLFCFWYWSTPLMKISCRIYLKVKPNFILEVWIQWDPDKTCFSKRECSCFSPCYRLLRHTLCFLGLLLILSTYLCWGYWNLFILISTLFQKNRRGIWARLPKKQKLSMWIS